MAVYRATADRFCFSLDRIGPFAPMCATVATVMQILPGATPTIHVHNGACSELSR